jgi:hypothetical protein
MSALLLALAQQFVERPGAVPGPAVWSEAAAVYDADRDGRWDLIVVNAQGYAVPGDFRAPSAEPVAPTLLLGSELRADGTRFRDASSEALPRDLRLHAKDVVAADLDGDGLEDLAIAVAFGARPRLLRRDPAALRYLDESVRLPDLALNSFSVGCGDMDDDGDLDLVFADSGARSFGGHGGRPRLFLNDGRGNFADASARLGERREVGQQNVKLIDLDGDLDLDLVLDAKAPRTPVWWNDGAGGFELDVEVVPPPEWAPREFARDPATGREHDDDMGTYEIEWGDLDGDLDLDAVYMNYAMGREMPFRDGTLENTAEPGERPRFAASTATFEGDTVDDENDLVFLDVDDDGDLDVLVSVLPYFSGPEKLFENGGALVEGGLRLVAGAFTQRKDATLDLAVADFDGDADYDVISLQGEIPDTDFANVYYENTGRSDTRPPRIGRVTALPERVALAQLRRGLALRAWITDALVDDERTQCRAVLAWSATLDGANTDGSVPMPHVGGMLHRARLLPAAPGGRLVGARVQWHVLAWDAVGHQAIGETREFVVTGAESFGSGVGLALSAEALPQGRWRVRVEGDRPGVQGELLVGARSDVSADVRGGPYVDAEGARVVPLAFGPDGAAEVELDAGDAEGVRVLQAFAPGPLAARRSSPGLAVLRP